MYTKTFITAAFAAVTAAAPTARQSPDIIALTTVSTGGGDFLQRAVVENGLKFWIGKVTATYCPSDSVPNCPDSEATQFGATSGNTGVAMNAIVPGGQEVYVANDGSLSTTQAHSHTTGTNGMLGPFTYTPGVGYDQGNLTFNDNTFTACPNGTVNVYQIFALGYPGYTPAADCRPVVLRTNVVAESNPPWQYI